MFLSALPRVAVRRFTRGLFRALVPGGTAVSLWAAAALLVGLALRVGWYVADPCVWGDEVWLIANVQSKSFADLIGPLDNNQAAPPAFLWAVKVCVIVLGDGTHALRLLPFFASCAGLVLVAAVGGGYPRAGAWIAVVLLAGSSKMLGHTAELKPYTLDFFVAAAVAVWFCRSTERPLAARIKVAVAICPLVVLLVYPGCFIAGGVLLGLAVGARRRNELLLLALAGATTGAAFALLLAGPASAQQTPNLREYWVQLGHFPNWFRPHTLPGWLWSGASGVFRYCLYPLGTAFVPLAVIGFAVLWRNGRRDVAVFLVGPLAVAAVAGVLGKYPFGGSRLHLYAAPGLALLVAVGIRWAWERLAALRSSRARLARIAVAVVATWGIVEGITFPLLSAGRVDVRPAVEFLKTRPTGEPVFVTDDVVAYYLRRDPLAVRTADGIAARSSRAWMVGVFDRPGTVPSEPFVDRTGLPVATRHEFGAVSVFRLEAPGTAK